LLGLSAQHHVHLAAAFEYPLQWWCEEFSRSHGEEPGAKSGYGSAFQPGQQPVLQGHRLGIGEPV
jgi:hypothetical protein